MSKKSHSRTMTNYLMMRGIGNEKTVELSANGVKMDFGKVKAIDDLHMFDEIECLVKTVVLPPFSIRYVEFH